jgi:glycosyltransferase involved in cell wall biosynthesis
MARHVPKISVVMPVHNALPFLDASIRSILEQSHSDFEFIIRDDGSTDGTREVLRLWAKRDSRIRLFESNTSLGPAGSADWVVRQATTSIVARMDADDVAHPERLQRELDVLTANPDVLMVGSLFEGIDCHDRVVRVRDRSPLASKALAAPFPHGSIMFRREAFERVGGYRSACAFWEDLDLYFRFAALGRVVVLPEPLYRFRFSSTSTRLTSRQEAVEQAVDLMFQCIDSAARTGDYEHLLGRRQSRSRKVRPQVFVSFGSIRLWSGHSPGTLLKMIRRSSLRFDLATLKVLIWSVWASLSPRTLRWSLNQLLRSRDRRANEAFAEGRFYDWGFQRSRASIASYAAISEEVGPASQAAATPSTPFSSTPKRPAMLGPRSSTFIPGSSTPPGIPAP